MRLLPLIMFALPGLLLLAGWLLGFASIKRAAVFLVGWILACEAVGIWALLSFNDPRGFVFAVVAVVFALLGPLLAVAFGMTSKPVGRPPIVIAAEAYDNLDASQKEALRKGTRLAAKLAAQHLSDHLRDKGHVRTAEALRDGARMI